MRAWLIISGNILKETIEFYRTIRINSGDLIIAVDGGYDNAILFGMLPSVVIGDLDSVKSSISKGTKILQYPVDKDKTDLELAIDYAIGEGFAEIVVLGNIGGKFSHSLANIMLLKYIQSKGCEGMLLSAKERVSLLTSGNASIPRSESKYLSIIPLTPCENVTILNTKYEIRNANIEMGSTHLISNEFTALDAKISIEKGEVLIITEK